jgi:DegV family protein with EDD domain
MPVSIITDSVACLPGSLVEKLGITVIPLEIIHRGKVYRDGVDMSPSEFYKLLEESDVLPTTTAPTPLMYSDVFEKKLALGKEVLVICPSTRLTHVFTSASLAADMVREKSPDAPIRIIDSGTAAGAEGLVVLDAAAFASSAGVSLMDVENRVQKVMREVHLLAYIDTIDYLAKSGRVPYILAWANSLLKIKPVIELLPSGKGVVPLGRSASSKHAVNKMIEIIKKRTNGLSLRVIVHHTNAPADAELMAESIVNKLDCDKLYIQDFTPVMGVHTGPGLVGVAYCVAQVP